jgi:hypothetical protein
MPFDEPFVKAPKKEEPKEPGWLAKAGGLLITALIIFPVFLLGLAVAAVAFEFAWNTGLTGLVAACGGSVSDIDYRTAFGAIIVLMFLRSLTGVDTKRKAAPTYIVNSGGTTGER